jgi:hypothetical protein
MYARVNTTQLPLNLGAVPPLLRDGCGVYLAVCTESNRSCIAIDSRQCSIVF